jgi:myosin heavy subunit
VVSANAVQAAPVGLAAALSTAALAGTNFATAATAAKAIVMTTLQKTIITGTLVAAVGAGICEARQATSLRSQVQTLQQLQTPLAEQIQQLTSEGENAARRLAALRDENERLTQNSTELLKLRSEVTRLKNEAQNLTQARRAEDSTAESARAMVNRVNQLKQYLEQNAIEKIPELQFVSDNAWIMAVSNQGLETKDFETDGDYKYAAERLRGAAENRFAKLVQEALRKYSTANNQQVPSDLSQMQQYCEAGVGDVLQRLYEIKPKSALPEGALKDMTIKEEWLITRKQGVDPNSSYRLAIFPYNTVLWQSPR